MPELVNQNTKKPTARTFHSIATRVKKDIRAAHKPTAWELLADTVVTMRNYRAPVEVEVNVSPEPIVTATETTVQTEIETKPNEPIIQPAQSPPPPPPEVIPIGL